MTNKAIEIQYLKMEYLLKKAKEEASYILENEMHNKSIKIHAIHSRQKTIDSIKKKIERFEQQGSGSISLESLVDLVGIRVVCLFRSDILKIGELIRDKFVVVSEDDKVEGAEVSSFGYQSVHFVVKIKDDCVGARYDDIKQIKMEIQLRTIAMDAWAAASHYLDYKSEHGVPASLRKDFFALSGLFYVADTHFEMFYKEAQASRENAKHETTKEKSDQLLNFDTLQAYLLASLPKRKHSESGSVSVLLDELLTAGITKTSELEKQVQYAEPAFLRYEEDHPPSTKSKRFADVGVVRVSLEIVNDEFLMIRKGVDKELQEEDRITYVKYRKYLIPKK